MIVSYPVVGKGSSRCSIPNFCENLGRLAPTFGKQFLGHLSPLMFRQPGHLRNPSPGLTVLTGRDWTAHRPLRRGSLRLGLGRTSAW